MDEKKKRPERHWKAYKQKNGNGLDSSGYGLVFVGLGGLVFLGGIQEKDMYQILKDDEYLTDDGLPIGTWQMRHIPTCGKAGRDGRRVQLASLLELP